MGCFRCFLQARPGVARVTQQLPRADPGQQGGGRRRIVERRGRHVQIVQRQRAGVFQRIAGVQAGMPRGVEPNPSVNASWCQP